MSEIQQTVEERPEFGMYDTAAVILPPETKWSLGRSEGPSQERVILNSSGGVLGIMDGMSENQPAATAAEIAAMQFGATLAGSSVHSIGDAEYRLLLASEATHKAFQRHIDEHPDDHHMGTTVLVGQVVTDEHGVPTDLVVAQAGRSRMFLVRDDGSVVRVTRDHNYLEERVRPEGEPRVIRKDSPFAEEEIFSDEFDDITDFFDTKHLTNYFSAQGCNPEITAHSLVGVSAIVAMSDGVHDYYDTDEEIAFQIKGAQDARTMVQKLHDGAKAAEAQGKFADASDERSVVVLVLNPQAFSKP